MRTVIVAAGLALAVISVTPQDAFAEMSGSPKIDPSIVEKAGENGLVRVIVAIDATTEAAQTAGSQCANEDCAKLEVANVMLPTEAPLIEMLPGNLVLMEATPAGLDVLQRLPQVISIVEDGADMSNEALDVIDTPND